MLNVPRLAKNYNKTPHEIRIPERDVIPLYVYLHTLIHRQAMNWKQHRYLIEVKLDFTEYIQYTDVRIVDLCCPRIYHLPGNIISATIGFVYINLQS